MVIQKKLYCIDEDVNLELDDTPFDFKVSPEDEFDFTGLSKKKRGFL